MHVSCASKAEPRKTVSGIVEASGLVQAIVVGIAAGDCSSPASLELGFLGKRITILLVSQLQGNTQLVVECHRALLKNDVARMEERFSSATGVLVWFRAPTTACLIFLLLSKVTGM